MTVTKHNSAALGAEALCALSSQAFLGQCTGHVLVIGRTGDGMPFAKEALAIRRMQNLAIQICSSNSAAFQDLTPEITKQSSANAHPRCALSTDFVDQTND